MLKVYKEIGLNKFTRFIIYSIWQTIFNWLIFPPLRVWWLRLGGAYIGRNTVIYDIKLHNLYHHGLKNLHIGHDCFLGSEILLDLTDKIYLADQVSIGDRTIFSTHINVGYQNHPLQPFYPKKTKPIYIGRGCFIGVGSIILAGTKLEEGDFVPAGVVIHGKIPSWYTIHRDSTNKLVKIKH